MYETLSLPSLYIFSVEIGSAASPINFFCFWCYEQITLQLEPMFKRSITYKVQEDEGLEHKIVDFAKNTHYGDVRWYPSKGEAIYRYDYKVAASTPGEGVNDFVAFRLQNASVLLANRDLGLSLSLTHTHTALTYSLILMLSQPHR